MSDNPDLAEIQPIPPASSKLAARLLLAGLALLGLLGCIGLARVLAHPTVDPIPDSIINATVTLDDDGDASLCATLLQTEDLNAVMSYIQQVDAALKQSDFMKAGELSGSHAYCPPSDNFAWVWQRFNRTDDSLRQQAWLDFQQGWATGAKESP